MNKKVALFLLIALTICAIVGTYGGYFYGKHIGSAEMKKIVEIVYPKPQNELFELTGIITGLDNSRIKLEVRDPNDYLPHADGTDSKKQMRDVFITSATRFTLTDLNKLDAEANPLTIPVSYANLKIGMTAAIKSDINIKNLLSFAATEVNAMK